MIEIGHHHYYFNQNRVLTNRNFVFRVETVMLSQQIYLRSCLLKWPKMYQFIYLFYKISLIFRSCFWGPKEISGHNFVSVSSLFIVCIYSLFLLEHRKYSAFSGVVVVSGCLQNWDLFPVVVDNCLCNFCGCCLERSMEPLLSAETM